MGAVRPTLPFMPHAAAPADPPPRADAQALWQLDATALLAGYRSGAFTPVDALQSVLARIARWQPHANAFVHIDERGALAAAQASARRWAAGAPQGLLDGVALVLRAMAAQQVEA